MLGFVTSTQPTDILTYRFQNEALYGINLLQGLMCIWSGKKSNHFLPKQKLLIKSKKSVLIL
jgi:hypothetical protein